MATLEIRNFPGDPDRKLIVALEADGTQLGQMDYVPTANSLAEAGYLVVGANYRRRGVAHEILRKLKDEVGAGVQLTTGILHEPTLQVLADASYLKTAVGQSKADVDPNDFPNLPLAKLFADVGFAIDKIEIKPTHIVTTRMSFDQMAYDVSQGNAWWSSFFEATMYFHTPQP